MSEWINREVLRVKFDDTPWDMFKYVTFWLMVWVVLIITLLWVVL